MRLVEALRLGSHPGLCLALVGAGGKTGTMFRLGRELLEDNPSLTVLLTTTTHFGAWQVDQADYHFTITSTSQLTQLQAALPAGLVLLSGTAIEDGRIAGLAGDFLDGVHDLVQAKKLPLLIEADGSRQRPLKAPDAHEPLIPSWVDQVLVVVGCSGLGQALAAPAVHRPERFAELSGLEENQAITVEALGRVLCHPEGGLKGIPEGAQRVALLNQAETPERQAQALRLAGLLLPSFHAVLIASLEDPKGFEKPLGSVGAPVYAVHEPAAAVVLAAGDSTRFGRPKQVLTWRDRPLVAHVVSTALGAGLSPVIVVCGASAGEVETALAGLPVQCVYNPDWQAGQGTSVAVAVRCLPAGTGSAVFLLADQPQTPPSLVRGLLDLHSVTLAPIVATQVLGQRASPVLFDRVTFADLQSLAGEAGGRVLFARYRPAWLPWQDANQLLDVDTVDDYRRLLELE